MNEVQSDALSDELLDEDIPCMVCGNPARLRSFGHGTSCRAKVEGTPRPPWHRCIPCWQDWCQNTSGKLDLYGAVKCWDCCALFPNLQSFSDYREF